jgi:hypothetical protein
MGETRTKPGYASVERYLAAIEYPQRRADCEALARLMARLTGETARMWGTAIVGFGMHHYKYASGREGDTCRVGFSSRKGDISVYGVIEHASPAQLRALGKHKAGVGCLYIRKLDEIDTAVLEKLIAAAAKAKPKAEA